MLFFKNLLSSVELKIEFTFFVMFSAFTWLVYKLIK